MKEYCTNASCTQSDCCMRFQKFQEEESNYIKVVNPKKVTGDSACAFFLSCENTRFAKGFIHYLSTLSRVSESRFRRLMIGHYPRNKYFKMRKGEILCSPADQDFIVNLLSQLNLPTDNVFDDWIEKQDW